MLGTAELRRLLEQDGIGFVVYKAALEFKLGARFGDTVTIRTTVHLDSPYRAVFRQDACLGAELLVTGTIQLACVDRDGRLVPIPASAVRVIEASPEP